MAIYIVYSELLLFNIWHIFYGRQIGKNVRNGLFSERKKTC